MTGEQKNEKTIQRIKHIIANVNDKLDCKMQFLEGDMEYIKRIFPSVKHFITNRREETVRLICEAELYGDEIEIISGIDFPIFSTGKTRGSVSIKKQK